MLPRGQMGRVGTSGGAIQQLSKEITRRSSTAGPSMVLIKLQTDATLSGERGFFGSEESGKDVSNSLPLFCRIGEREQELSCAIQYRDVAAAT